jgi:polysaccharide biosynthesis transport protein
VVADPAGGDVHGRDPDIIDLRDHLTVLRRRKVTVIATVVAVVAAGLGFTLLQTPQYEAEAKVVVSAVSAPGVETASGDLSMRQRELETQREIVRSVPVAQGVIEELELDIAPGALLSRVRAETVRDTDVMSIRVRALDPEEAATLTQAFAQMFLEHRREEGAERTQAALADLEGRVAGMRQRLEEIGQEGQDATGQSRAALEEEQAALMGQMGHLSAQLANIRGSQAALAGGGQILAPAITPTSPVSPRPARNAALALLVGTILGVGAAFVRDQLDDVIWEDEDVTTATGRPVLGHVPLWEEGENDDRSVVLLAPSSPAAEAFRTLRTNLQFLSVDDPTRTILVTSTKTGEGKSTTAANLAVAAAMSGARVLLVGADLRKPTVHRLFGISAVNGLSDVLAGRLELEEALRDVGVDELRVLPSGETPPNPVELIASSRMDHLIAQARQAADLVIFDGTPALGVADALALAPRVDGVLLVADAGHTERRGLRAATERLSGVGARVLGATLNRIQARGSYYGYYYSRYEHEDGEGRGAGGRRWGPRRASGRGDGREVRGGGWVRRSGDDADEYPVPAATPHGNGVAPQERVAGASVSGEETDGPRETR